MAADWHCHCQALANPALPPLLLVVMECLLLTLSKQIHDKIVKAQDSVRHGEKTLNVAGRSVSVEGLIKHAGGERWLAQVRMVK